MFIWTIGDALAVFFVLAFGLVFLAVWAHQALTQWRCKHDSGVNETMACHAICRKCGADLGFIGTWREKHPQ